MKINKRNALKLWNEFYGDVLYAADFHGNLMYRDAYGDRDFCIQRQGLDLYCGWNLHHILALSHGGSKDQSNLVCTNIITNDEAEDKITFWIDNVLYQVRKIPGTQEYEIVCIKEE